MIKIEEFDFDLPEELIAVYPRQKRSSSRLLVLDRRTGEIEHTVFSRLPEILTDQYLIVYNDTRVIPARLHLRKETGGKIEVLLDHPVDSHTWVGLFSASRKPAIDSLLLYQEEPVFRVIDLQNNMITVRYIGSGDLSDFLEKAGEPPLPPYILKRRQGKILPEDREFYQTIFARKEGAVAAPTAGIHFDEEIWRRIAEKGIKKLPITLHVGIGTFLPVKENDVSRHRMHSERVEISDRVAKEIIDWKRGGGKILAIGTTTVRTLEGVATRLGELRGYRGEVDIFIYPGYQFKVVDAMITNFHLPRSTLILMVSAFAGKEKILRAYREAIARGYKFYSYGDAMLIR